MDEEDNIIGEVERVLKTVSLKNLDGCTSYMPSSPKEYKPLVLTQGVGYLIV